MTPIEKIKALTRVTASIKRFPHCSRVDKRLRTEQCSTAAVCEAATRHQQQQILISSNHLYGHQRARTGPQHQENRVSWADKGTGAVNRALQCFQKIDRAMARSHTAAKDIEDAEKCQMVLLRKNRVLSMKNKAGELTTEQRSARCVAGRGGVRQGVSQIGEGSAR